ncbi:MAG TPA: TRAP transporter small permease subunit, partial [Burkholderiaceae bacterium]|nr:TRAP transporter small permease subunit [Burkholderiaceae bacterium]
MQTFLLFIDAISTFVGKIFAWLIVSLTLMISYEVFSRYALGEPHAWVFDVSNMMYGTLFMMAGAYTLAKKGHVRGDILYGFLTPRVQASIDLVLYIVFFIPGVIALVWAGWEFFGDSLAQNERSSIAADGPPIYPFKLVIPIA